MTSAYTSSIFSDKIDLENCFPHGLMMVIYNVILHAESYRMYRPWSMHHARVIISDCTLGGNCLVGYILIGNSKRCVYIVQLAKPTY